MLANLSVFPLGQGVSLRGYVTEALQEIQKSGIKYELTDMGTILEGNWDSVMAVIKKIHDRLLSQTDRLYITVSIDSRKDKAVELGSKVKVVQSELAKKRGRSE